MDKGREPPDWYLDQPEIVPGDEFYLSAFYELSTTRDTGFGSGPIPWQHILAYSNSSGFEDDVRDAFIRIIRAMDRSYLAWVSEEDERKRRNDSSKSSRRTKS